MDGCQGHLREPAEAEGQVTGDFKVQLEASNKKVEEYTVMLKRLQADFENHLKRSEAQRRDLIKIASQDLVVNMLGVLDSLAMAMKVEAKDDDGRKILDGIKRVDAQLKAILSAEGLEEIRADGRFDPANHEVIDAVERTDKPDGTILDVVQTGYRLNDRVIRTAKVVVVKNRGECNG